MFVVVFDLGIRHNKHLRLYVIFMHGGCVVSSRTFVFTSFLCVMRLMLCFLLLFHQRATNIHAVSI